jgi:hypothetical protein
MNSDREDISLFPIYVLSLNVLNFQLNILWILKRQDRVVWTRLIWLEIETSEGLL